MSQWTNPLISANVLLAVNRSPFLCFCCPSTLNSFTVSWRVNKHRLWIPRTSWHDLLTCLYEGGTMQLLFRMSWIIIALKFKDTRSGFTSHIPIGGIMGRGAHFENLLFHFFYARTCVFKQKGCTSSAKQSTGLNFYVIKHISIEIIIKFGEFFVLSQEFTILCSRNSSQRMKFLL